MACGVSLTITANLGVSPISSLPYVSGLIFRKSTGTLTIIINTFFLFLEILILRKDFHPFQLLQLPAVMLFGVLIDAFVSLFGSLTPSVYGFKLLSCAAGIALQALGVYLVLRADLVLNPADGLVKTLSSKTGRPFGNVKTAFDLTMAILSILLSLIFLHGLSGIREGTIFSAVFVGQFTTVLRNLFG